MMRFERSLLIPLQDVKARLSAISSPSAHGWMREIAIMEQQQCKAEIECMNSSELDFLTSSYIDYQLSRKCWV